MNTIDFATRRKAKLRADLIEAARAFRDHVRTHEVPPAAFLLQLNDGEVIAIGKRADVVALAGTEAGQ